MGWTTGVRFPVGLRLLSLHHLVQTGPRAHPDTHTMDIGVPSLGVTRPGCEADYSNLVPSLRMRGAMPPLPLISSWYGA